MVGMRNSNVTEKIKCQKIDKYFYRDPNGNILKYSHYCIEKNCKTESSYNYENLKPIYCNKHKLERIVNVKRNHKSCQECEKGYLKNVILQNVNLRLKIIKMLHDIQNKKL